MENHGFRPNRPVCWPRSTNRSGMLKRVKIHFWNYFWWYLVIFGRKIEIFIFSKYQLKIHCNSLYKMTWRLHLLLQVLVRHLNTTNLDPSRGIVLGTMEVFGGSLLLSMHQTSGFQGWWVIWSDFWSPRIFDIFFKQSTWFLVFAWAPKTQRKSMVFCPTWPEQNLTKSLAKYLESCTWSPRDISGT